MDAMLDCEGGWARVGGKWCARSGQRSQVKTCVEADCDGRLVAAGARRRRRLRSTARAETRAVALVASEHFALDYNEYARH